MQGSTSTSGRRLATAALLGVGSALTIGAQAHADGVVGAKVGNTESVGTVHLTVEDQEGNSHDLAANTGLIDLKTGTDSDDNLLKTYCIQLDTQLNHSETYDEKNWSDLKPPIPADNLHEIWWVLDNSYPAVPVGSLNIAGLTTGQAVEATQAAIWHLVDASDHPSLNTAKNAPNVVSLYNYLVQQAGLHKGDPGSPAASLGITPAAKSGAQPGVKTGPFTIESSDQNAKFVSLGFGTGAAAPPAGTKIVDAAGAAITSTTLLKNGDRFWVEVPAGVTGSGGFTVKAWGRIPVLEDGRVFMTHDGKVSQNLILGGSGQVDVSAQTRVSWQSTPTKPPTTPPPTTPPPTKPPVTTTTPPVTLAHTGAGNSLGYGEAAFALVAAGGGLMLLSRRPRTRRGTHR